MASTLSAPNPIKDIYKKLVFYDVAHGSNAFEFQYTNASTLEDVPITDIKNDFIFHKKLTLLSTIQNSDSYVGSYTQSALNNNPINVAQLHSDIYGDDYNQTEVPDYLPKHRYEETWTLTNASLMEVDLEERNQRYDKDIQQDYEFDKLQLLVAGTTWTESQYEADEENPYNPYTTADPTVLRPTSSFIANSTPSNLGDAAATNLIEADTILDKEIEHNRTWLETAWNYINGTDGGSAPAHPGGAVAGEPSLFDGTLWTADGYYINDASNDPNPTRPGGAAGPAITTNMFNAIQNLDTESRANEEWLNAINKWIDSSDVDNTDQTLSWASPADNWSEFSVLTTGTYTANPVNAAVSGDMVDALTHMDMNIRLLKYQIDKNKDNTTAVIDDDGGTDWVQNTLRRSLTELRDDFDALKTTMDGSGNTTGGGFTYASTVGDTYANQDTLHGDISEIDAQLEAATTMITGGTTAGAQYSTDVDGVENSVESDIERLHDLSISDTWSHKNRLDQIVNSSTGKLVNASADVLDMASKRITNLANPSATFDAATKSWVETQVAGAVQGHGVQVCTFRLGDSANVPGTDLAPGGGIMAVDCSSAQNWALAGDTSAESLENSGAGADYNHGGITLDGTGYAPKSTMASGCYIDGHLMVEGDLVILTEEGATTCDGVTADEANNHWGSAHDSDIDDWHWRNGVWKFNYSGTNSGVWERPSAGDALWEDGNALAQGLIHAVEFGKDEGDNDVVWAFWTIQPELTYTYGENCIIASNYTDAKATFDLGDGKSPRNAWSVFTALQAFNEGNVTTIEDANTVQVTLDSESLTAVGATGSPLSGGTLTANLDGVMTKTGSGINLNFDALDFVDDGGVLKLLTTRADTMTSTNIGSNTLVANLTSYEGLVGIGTATPSNNLDIEDSANSTNVLEMTNTDTGSSATSQLSLYNSNSNVHFGYGSTGHSTYPGKIFLTASSSRDLCIMSGNVGIGTATPSVNLEIASNAGHATLALYAYNSSAGDSLIKFGGRTDSTSDSVVGDFDWGIGTDKDGSNNFNICYSASGIQTASASQVLSIDTSGNVGIGTDSPGSELDLGGGYMVDQGRQDHVANTMSSPYYHFDGTNDYVDITDSSIFNNQSFTISAWVKIDMNDDYNGIFEHWQNSPSWGYSFFVNSTGKLRSYVGDGSSANSLEATTVLNTGQWYHCVTTYTSGTHKIYLNGCEDGSATTAVTIIFPAGNLTIGKPISSSLKGDISNVKCYNVALTATEVKELYSGASVPFKYLLKGAEYISDFSTVDGWVSGGNSAVAGGISYGGEDDVLRLTDDATSGTHWMAKTLDYTLGKKYRVSFDYFIDAGNSTLVGIYTEFGAAVDILAANLDETDNWTNVTVEIVKRHDNGILAFYCRDESSITYSGSGESVYIKDLTVTEVGCIAEYDGSSATSSLWQDKSGNGNDGTVSGAILTNAKVGNVEVSAGGGADVRIIRSDSTTTDGESLGRILWSSTDGNLDTVDGSAVIEVLAAEDYGTGNKGADMRFSLKALSNDFNHAANEYMRITSEGNVGIGNDDPEQNFVVSNGTSANPVISLSHNAEVTSGNGIGTIEFASSGDSSLGAYTVFSKIVCEAPDTVTGTASVNGELQFWTVDANSLEQRMTITEDGNVGIGENGPAHGFAVDKIRDGYYIDSLNNGSDVNPYGLEIKFDAAANDNNTTKFLECADSGNVRMYVYSDGDIHVSDGGSVTTSDENLKTNIVDASSKLEDVNKLRVRNFEWTSEYHPAKEGEKKIGFIAQEFEEVFPSLVREHLSPIIAEKEQGIKRKSIKMALVPILVKAIQELSAKVDTLENKVEALENSLSGITVIESKKVLSEPPTDWQAIAMALDQRLKAVESEFKK